MKIHCPAANIFIYHSWLWTLRLGCVSSFDFALSWPFFSLFRNQNECAGYWPWPFPSSSLWKYDKKSPSCFSYFSFSVCIASSPLFSSKGLTMPHWIAPDHSVLKSLTLSVTVSHILLACKNTYGHTATSFIISFSLYLCPHLWTFCMLHYHNSSLMH